MNKRNDTDNNEGRDFLNTRVGIAFIASAVVLAGLVSIQDTYTATGTISDTAEKDYALTKVTLLDQKGLKRIFDVTTASYTNYGRPLEGRPATIAYRESYLQHFLLPMLPTRLIPDEYAPRGLYPQATDLRVYKKPEAFRL